MIRVTVAYAALDVEAIVPLSMPAGASLLDAVAASGLCERYGLSEPTIAYAIHGQRADQDTPLADGDRVEITGALRADPREARRRRAAVQSGKRMAKGNTRLRNAQAS
ncbi:MAG: RnfH family protein [Burkholderiales bacterium]|nr:RnfH family protein [Burkholderiales bacterium]